MLRIYSASNDHTVINMESDGTPNANITKCASGYVNRHSVDSPRRQKEKGIKMKLQQYTLIAVGAALLFGTNTWALVTGDNITIPDGATRWRNEQPILLVVAG
jgi:hypothetical protein